MFGSVVENPMLKFSVALRRIDLFGAWVLDHEHD